MEIGSIVLFCGSVIPDHCLLCDGSAVSRSEYSDLFDAIGTTYGVGDGSTTFNLPDMSGRVPMGVSQAHVLGSTGGEATHTLLGTEIASHAHAVAGHTHTNSITAETPTYAHSITRQPGTTYSKLNGTTKYNNSIANTSAFASVKTAAMTRATNFGVSDHPATACTMSGGITDCAAFDTENAGQGQAHNNMMPYLALAYIIQAEPDTPPEPSMALIHNGTVIPVTAGGAYIAGRK